MSEIWFIKEGAIEGEVQDEFAHRDVAIELKAKIEQLGAPLTLSLEAPHGVGKSCVGALLREQMSGDDYEFVSIEAWRHADDSRRKAFLYDVIQELREKRECKGEWSDQLKDVQEQIYRTRAHLSPVVDGEGVRQSFNVLREGWPYFWKSCKNILGSPKGIIATVAILITFVSLWVWLLGTAGTSPLYAVLGFSAASVALLQLLGLGALLVGLSGLGSKVIPQWLEASRVTITTAPPSSSEQFETLFRQALTILKNERQKQGKEPRTLILFVDELDRLPEKEIIDALNVLRAFRDVKPCVVIVALDESVVKRALRNRTDESAGAIADDVEAEEYLNKFFKSRQHLPPVVVQEMSDFARTLIGKGRLNAGIGALRGVELDAVLDCLIHPGVATPRHVIRLLNAFNSDLHLARGREENKQNNILRAGSLTHHLPFLALLTALHEDFAHFHATMTTNSELLRVMDVGLERKFDEGWKREFPDYIAICARFFASQTVAEATIADAVQTQWDKPLPGWRDLILHLRATRRHHRTEVAPFLFFRQDVAARALGSEEARALREELASNFTTSIRTRLEREGEPFARLLATTAGHALAETRGSKRANVIASLCDLWEILAPALDEPSTKTLADTIARLVDEDTELLPFLSIISPLPLLKVLASDAQGYHQKRCVHFQIERLGAVVTSVEATDAADDANELEAGTAILDGVLLHPEVVAEADFDQIKKFTAWLTSQLTLEELVPWLHKGREGAGSPRVVPGFFGSDFVDGLFEALKLGEVKDVSADVTQAARGFFEVVEDTAHPMWADQWLENLLSLRDAKTWPMRDLALSFLARQVNDVPETEAAKVAAKVLSSSQAEKRGMDAWNSLADFLRSITQKHQNAVWDEESIEALDTLSAKIVALDKDDLRLAAYDLLKFLAPLVQETGTLPLTLAALIQYVTDKAPDARVNAALEMALLWHASGDENEWQTFYVTLSSPLESLSSSSKDEITFGANAFIITMRDGTPEVALNAASQRLPSILSLLSSGSYTTDSLLPLAPMLDRLLPIWKVTPSHLPIYLGGLNSLLGSARTDGAINFVASRLDVLRENESIDLKLPDNYKQAFVASFIAKWPLIKSPDTRQLVAVLLLEWLEHLQPDSIETLAEQQLVYLPENLDTAWRLLSGIWTSVTQATQLKILTTLWPKKEDAIPLSESQQSALQTQALQSLADKKQMLTAPVLAPLLLAVERQFHWSDSEPLKPLTVALTAPCDEATRQQVAEQLLANFGSQTDILAYVDQLAMAFAVQSAPLPDAWFAMQKLLVGGDKTQSQGLALIDAFMRVNLLNDAQKEEFANIVRDSVDSAKGAALTAWLKNLQKWDLMRFEATQTALKSNSLARGRSRAQADKTDKNEIRRALEPFRAAKK